MMGDGAPSGVHTRHISIDRAFGSVQGFRSGVDRFVVPPLAVCFHRTADGWCIYLAFDVSSVVLRLPVALSLTAVSPFPVRCC